MSKAVYQYLIYTEIGARVRYNAHDVGYEASVERLDALVLVDLEGAVHHALVLARLPQRQARLQHLTQHRRGSENVTTLL